MGGSSLAFVTYPTDCVGAVGLHLRLNRSSSALADMPSQRNSWQSRRHLSLISCTAGMLAVAATLQGLASSSQNFVGSARIQPAIRSKMQLGAQRQDSSDNFIDKAFTVMADIVVSPMPLAQQ